MDSKQIGLKLSTVALAVLLASCGGGGSGGYYENNNGGSSTGGDGSSTVVGAKADALRYSLDKDSLIAGGELEVSVVAIDDKGNVISDKTPTVRIKNLASTQAVVSPTEKNESGWSTFKLSLANSNDAFDKMSHNVVLEITSDQVTQEVIVPVSGGVIDLASDVTAIKNNSLPTSVRIHAVDASLKPLVGKIEIRNKKNQLITTTNTNTNGDATANISYNDIMSFGENHHLDLYAVFVVTKNNETRTLSSQALGFTATVEDTSVIEFNQPLTDIKSGEKAEISVNVYANTQAELTGKFVTFETSLGQITVTGPVLNIQQNSAGKWQGTAKATLDSATTSGNVIGNATVAATFSNSTVTTQQSINALVVANLSLQASATSVGVGSTVKLNVTAKDAKGYLVKGAKVSFKIIADPSLGSLSRVSAVTNEQGIATIDYTAGASATQSNAVILQATSDLITSNVLNLTVANQSAYISIAEGASLDATEPTYYSKNYSVNVVDSLQRPLKNQVVSLSVQPVAYKLGYLTWNSGENKWVKTETSRTLCKEFSTGAILLTNNLSQSGQQSITGTTDESGNLNFKVKYGKNYAWWVEANVIASTTLTTRVYNQSVVFDAPMALDDVKSEATPANYNSPYKNFMCPN